MEKMDQKINYSKIYSPSRLSMFDVCPKQYNFYYLDPIYSKMKNDLKKRPQHIWPFHTLGKAVHNAITLFYHSPSTRRTKEELKKYLKETWQSEVMANKKPPLGKWGGFKDIEEERGVYGQALLMLANFFQIVDIEPEIAYLPTGDFRRSINDYTDLIKPLSLDFDISGKFDLIVKDGDFLHVIDFKTGKAKNNDLFQLKFYKVLAEENFGKPVKRASFYFLKDGDKREFDLENQDSEKIKEEILAKINQINKTEKFETKPGKLCQYCLFKTFCPEKGEVAQVIKEVKEEDYSDDLPF